MKELLEKIKKDCEKTDKCTLCDYWALCNVSPCCWSDDDIKEINKALERKSGDNV